MWRTCCSVDEMPKYWRYSRCFGSNYLLVRCAVLVTLDIDGRDLLVTKPPEQAGSAPLAVSKLDSVLLSHEISIDGVRPGTMSGVP
jgi:hypothetical protein